MTTKYEYKYLFESETAKVETLIDINGKNTYHIQELYADLKKKEDTINKLLTRLNEKREKIYELQTIIKSQSEKNLAEFLSNERVDN